MKTLTLLLLALTALLNAACLGHSPGEVYFEAWSKDGNGNYTVPTLYRTRDYGQTAQIVIENFDGFIHRDAKPGSFYKRIFGQGFFYSPDTCQTWIQRIPEYNYFQTGTHEGEIWGGVGYLSQDFGQNWLVHQLNGLDTYADSWSPGLLQGELYVFTHSKKLYRSTDYGNNFTFVSDITIPYALGPGYGWIPGELVLATSISDPQGKRYFRSVDYGLTFDYVYTLPDYLNSYQSLKGFVRDEYYRYAINRYNHPYYDSMDIKFMHTTNFGQTWDSVMTNYTTGIEENGEWRMENGELANYPNPFNNSTVVNYTLPNDNNIALAVYNAKGELVKNLYRGKQAQGIHQLTFNADGLNSGVYYLRLKAGNKLQTHKIILIK